MNVDLIDTIVSQYLKVFPEERASMAALIEQIVNETALNNRKTQPGHITGSAFVLSPDRDQLLLVNHKYLNIWFQPGGHWESDESDPWSAAAREAAEETGVRVGEPLKWGGVEPGVPLDIDIHLIPANPAKDEPDHYHYDFRYVFIADSLVLDTANAEYTGAKWFDLATPEVVALGKIMDKLRTYELAKH